MMHIRYDNSRREATQRSLEWTCAGLDLPLSNHRSSAVDFKLPAVLGTAVHFQQYVIINNMSAFFFKQYAIINSELLYSSRHSAQIQA